MITSFHGNNENSSNHRQQTAEKDPGYRPTDTLCPVHLESPTPELRIRDAAQKGGVQSKRKVIEPHSWFWRDWITRCILIADQRRVEERKGRYGVADKS